MNDSKDYIDMIDWDIIKESIELVKNNPLVNRVEPFKGKVIVYAIPSKDDPKNVIRVDFK
jgi:hypothetical protein